MPYIKNDERKKFIKKLLLTIMPFIYSMTNGEFNYVITKLCLKRPLLDYDDISNVTKVLSDVKNEFNRRIKHPYEDKKMMENGDVYNE